MIELTPEQQLALVQQGTEPVRVIDPATRATYVLVRADVYDRLQGLLQDESELNKRDVALLVERAMKEYDENDPTLDLYQHD